MTIIIVFTLTNGKFKIAMEYNYNRHVQNSIQLLGGIKVMVNKLEFYKKVAPLQMQSHINVTILYLNQYLHNPKFDLVEDFRKNSVGVEIRKNLYVQLNNEYNCKYLQLIIQLYEEGQLYVSNLRSLHQL